MQDRLRPTAEIAADAILVGDPGRALLLAQELLDQPRMSNHARGLWGYTGRTAGGRALTIQATGIGGPSAAVVLGELVGHGVCRAIRIGSCLGGGGQAPEPGTLLLVREAYAVGGSAGAFGVEPGAAASPDAELSRELGAALGADVPELAVASFDSPPQPGASLPGGAAVADMQTLALFAHGRELGIAVAATLIVVPPSGPDAAADDPGRDQAARRAGAAAAAALSG
jgi:uridine phosphorylase